MDIYNIGDYIEYGREYYNGGTYRYETCYHNGCIIEINKEKNYVNIIKQFGGQIWIGVKPIQKISEETFLSKFSIYNEYETELLNNIKKLPLHMQNIIKNKIEHKKNASIHNMIMYCIEMKSHYHDIYKDTSHIRIDDEVWAIKWYVLHVLRSYEPYTIQQTLKFCYGATDLIKTFMFNNVRFMISMQFQPYEEDHIMHLLIQEQWLLFLYSLNKIDAKEFSSRQFPIYIKKLEVFLTFKKPVVDDTDISILIAKDNNLYELNTTLLSLIDSKFVFENRYNKYVSNKKSNCSKRINVSLRNISRYKPKSKDTNFQLCGKKSEKCSQISCPEFITKKNYHLSYYLNSTKNLIIEQSMFSIGACSVKNFNIYCEKTKNLLGSFEFNTDEYDFGYISLQDIIF